MKTTLSRKPNQTQTWPRKCATGPGNRQGLSPKTPAGNFAYMVANYADGEQRRFDSYDNGSRCHWQPRTPLRANGWTNAITLPPEHDEEQAVEFASAVDAVAPFGVTRGRG